MAMGTLVPVWLGYAYPGNVRLLSVRASYRVRLYETLGEALWVSYAV